MNNNEYPPQPDEEAVTFVPGMIDGETGVTMTEQDFNRQQASSANATAAEYSTGAYQAPRYSFESQGAMVSGSAEEAAADAREDIAAALGDTPRTDTRSRVNSPNFVRDQISAMEGQFAGSDSPAQNRMQRVIERAQGVKAWAQEKAATPEGQRFIAMSKAVGKEALLGAFGKGGLGLVSETSKGNLEFHKMAAAKTAAEIFSGPVGWRMAATELGKGVIGGVRRGLRHGVVTHGKAYAKAEAGHQYKKLIRTADQQRRQA